MFTRSALALAFLASVVLGSLALAAPTAPVLLWMAVVAVVTLVGEGVFPLWSTAQACLNVERVVVRVDPAGGIGSSARRRIQTVPPIKMAAPPGLR